MTGKLSPPAVAGEPRPRRRTSWWPRRRVGWWSLALLVVAILSPAWWGLLQDLVASDVVLVVVGVGLAVASIGFGAFVFFRRRDRSVALGLSLAVVCGMAIAVLTLAVGLLVGPHEAPAFASLADHPDPSLHGTVAYLSDRTGCVRVRAASGTPVKDVYCIPAQDVTRAQKLGKEVGPQLVWRPDGRLEITMFRMTDPPGPGFRPGWQKVVDVRTGAVQDVPAGDVPSEPDRSTHPGVSPTGQRVTWTSTDNGHVEVVLHEGARSRTLLSAQGPGEGTYRLAAAFWAPGWQWIAADDGRILVMTTGHPARTRILTNESTRGAFDPELARFAVTGADLLSSSP